MNELQRELFEKQLLSISKGFDYPRTPDIAGSVMRRLSLTPDPSPAGRGEEASSFHFQAFGLVADDYLDFVLKSDAYSSRTCRDH